MEQRKLEIILGGLLHDVGKLIPVQGEAKDHGEAGYYFLKGEVGMDNERVLSQVHSHHSFAIQKASLPDDSFAYITYAANKIASVSDFKRDETDYQAQGKKGGLESIFNGIHAAASEEGEAKRYYYKAAVLEADKGIIYPEREISTEDAYYFEVKKQLKELFSQSMGNKEYPLTKIVEKLEIFCSFIPAVISENGTTDISFFDHAKMTSAVGGCIFDFLEEMKVKNYRRVLFDEIESFLSKEVFLLCTLDLSGIQSFIYGQYGKEDVLKNLRSRSFYLEMMMENLLDECLDKVGFSRVNVLYSGGGHAYLILPNTKKVREHLDKFKEEVNAWLLDCFEIELYCAMAYTVCSPNALRNTEAKGEGDSYKGIFRRLSMRLSQSKWSRFTSHQIEELNKKRMADRERECRICHRSDRLMSDGTCNICSALMEFSRGVLKNQYFYTEDSDSEKGSYLPIYKGRILCSEARSRQNGFIREYTKNMAETNHFHSKNVFVGDYHSANTLEELAEQGRGLRRLGVIRADVDNLGMAFVQGFNENYQSLSRSATFSRKLTQFFKFYINQLLESGDYSIQENLERKGRKRSAAIIYSGGDDLFIVGAWLDILEFSVDLYRSFKKFTQEKLSLSAGIGMFPPKYPISYMAEQTGALEESAKRMDGKSAVSLFNAENTYHWEEFIDRVLDEKLRTLQSFYAHFEGRGSSVLHQLLELYQNRGERINLARLAYLLSRMEPDLSSEESLKQEFAVFKEKVYRWMKNEDDAKQMITAIYIYAYSIRSEEE